MSRSRIGSGIVALLMASACGTGAEYKVDNQKVADLPQRERGELLARQGERARAKDEMEKANADVDTAEHSIAIAAEEEKQAHAVSRKLERDLYLTRLRQDVARLVRLEAERDLARLAEDAAETRVRWCKQEREVSKARMTAVTIRARLAQARIEQEQAHLAARHGLLPSRNFAVATFDQQVRWAERDNDQQRRNVLTETAERAALEKEYAQQLSLYSERRKQTPHFSSSYTPPGYPSPPTQTSGHDPILEVRY